MSQQIVIDSKDFSLEGRVLEGSLDLASLPRMADLLLARESVLAYRLEGRVSAQGKPQLRLMVSGALPLECQRCLERVDYDLEVDSLLELINDEADLTQEDLEDDSRDFVVADKTLNVVALIEDEVILALPPVPQHEDCSLPEGGQGKAKVSPFSVLAALKKTP